MMAEVARLRQASREHRAKLEARYPLLDAEGWMRRVPELAIASWRYAISADYRGLPCGDESSALIVLDAAERGRYWSTHRRGMPMVPIGHEPTVELAAHEGELPPLVAQDVRRACTAIDQHGLADVPARCYDGLPITLMVRAATRDALHRASCNAADSGQELALALAEAVLRAIPS